MITLNESGLKLVAQGLYNDTEKYVEARREETTKSENVDTSIIELLKAMKENMEQTPATETLKGSLLQVRIIGEKQKILSDLGILNKVYDEVEKIDEQKGTKLLDRLEYLVDY